MRTISYIFAFLVWFMMAGAHGQDANVSEKEQLSLHTVRKFCRYNNGKVFPQGGSGGSSASMTGIAGGWPGGGSLPAPDYEPLANLFNKFDSVVELPDYRREWFYPEGELDAGQQQIADMWRNNREGVAVAEYNKYSTGYQSAKIQHTRNWLTVGKPVDYERKYLLRVSRKVVMDDIASPVKEQIIPATIPAHATESSPRDLKPGVLYVETSFANNYKEELKVSLLPVEVVSRDKYLGGSITIPEDWNSLEMEFVGPDDISLGKYGNLLGGGTTKIIPKLDDILSDADYAAGFQSPDQKVWFVKNASDPRKIDFYTCFESLGDTQVKLYLNGSPEPFGEIAHSLTADPVMAQWIDYTDQWIKGTMFPWDEDIGPPVLGRQGAAARGVFDEMDNLTRAALIPLFVLVESVEGAGALLNGALDGFAAGAVDDWKLGKAVIGLTVMSVDWAASGASTQINLFIADPKWRAKCFYDLTKHIAEQYILFPIQQAAEQLGYTTTEMFASWEDFKNVSFRLMVKAVGTGVRITVMNAEIANAICGGIKGWFDNFSTRMMTGAEQTTFKNTPWDGDPFFAGPAGALTAVSYTTGYIAGYVTEQILVGMGAGTVAKVIARHGLVFTGKLLARVEFAVGTRMHALKKAIQGGAAGLEFEEVVRRGLSKTAREGFDPNVPSPLTGETLENMYRQWGQGRGGSGLKGLVDDLFDFPNIRKLTEIPGFEDWFAKRLAKISDLMYTAATPKGLKGFKMLYERTLWFDASGGFARDHFDELARVFRPTESAARRSKLNAALEQYSTLAGNLDDELSLFCFLSNKHPEKLVAAGEHPAVLDFTNLVKTRPPEIGKPISWAENAAIIRYERKTANTYRRLTDTDIPDQVRREAVDFINANQVIDKIEIKGPIMTTGFPNPAGFFEDYAAMTAERLNIGLAAVKKIRKNHFELDPPLPTKVVIDTFGLTTEEIRKIIDTINTSGLDKDLFIFLDNL